MILAEVQCRQIFADCLPRKPAGIGAEKYEGKWRQHPTKWEKLRGHTQNSRTSFAYIQNFAPAPLFFNIERNKHNQEAFTGDGWIIVAYMQYNKISFIMYSVHP
jgi:hypothetical protein